LAPLGSLSLKSLAQTPLPRQRRRSIIRGLRTTIVGDGRWTAWQKTKQPGFVLLHTHKGEKIDLYVQPIDDEGVPRRPASTILAVAGPTLTPDNPGGSEPGEHGKAELKPEPWVRAGVSRPPTQGSFPP
jgi:hypothetical protein